MTRDYSSNQKQSYGRGWAMNRMLERLPIPAREARLLTLAGEARDAELALNRGFRRHNVICVDRDRAAVQEARTKGFLAIEADISDFLDAWSSDLPFHALMLDFNCGYELPVKRALDTILQRPSVHARAAIYVNLQRGRDRWGRFFKAPPGRRSRIWPVMRYIAATAGVSLFQAQHIPTSIDLPSMDTRSVLRDPRYQPAIELAVQVMGALAARPYKQHDNGVYLDGLVFTNPRPVLGRVEHYRLADAVPPLVKRRVAALRAVRTKMAAQSGAASPTLRERVSIEKEGEG